MLENITTKITPVIGGGARYVDSEHKGKGQHLEITFLSKLVSIDAVYLDLDDYSREKNVGELLDRNAVIDLRDRLNAWLEAEK